MISMFPRAIAVALSLLIISTPAWAQSEGKLTGVVRDATNAGIPGATVAATSQSTTNSRTATTGADGSYSLSLPPAPTPSRSPCRDFAGSRKPSTSRPAVHVSSTGRSKRP